MTIPTAPIERHVRRQMDYTDQLALADALSELPRRTFELLAGLLESHARFLETVPEDALFVSPDYRQRCADLLGVVRLVEGDRR